MILIITTNDASQDVFENRCGNYVNTFMFTFCGVGSFMDPHIALPGVF